MARTRIYTITETTLKGMHTRFGDTYKCSRDICGRFFKVDDVVINKPTRGRGYSRWYHLRCWEELLIEVK